MVLAYTFSWLLVRVAIICLSIDIIYKVGKKILGWFTKK